jgi:hypothetical protein
MAGGIGLGTYEIHQLGIHESQAEQAAANHDLAVLQDLQYKMLIDKTAIAITYFGSGVIGASVLHDSLKQSR